MRGRAPLAGIAIVAGVVVALAPFAPWFAADTPAGEVTVTGVDASGLLLAAVVIGAAAVATALVVLRGGAARPLGAALAVLGGAALLAVLPVVASPPVHLQADVDGGSRSLEAPTTSQFAAYAAPLAAAALLLAGLGLARPVLRTRSGSP